MPATPTEMQHRWIQLWCTIEGSDDIADAGTLSEKDREILSRLRKDLEIYANFIAERFLGEERQPSALRSLRAGGPTGLSRLLTPPREEHAPMAKNRGNRPPRRDRHGVPEIPPEIETLRDARTVIDPARTYRLRMPDGSMFESTGAELLETAAAAVAVADADRAGDDEALRRALARLGLGPIPPREEVAPMARARKRNRDVVTITMAGSDETTRRVTEMFPGIEREAIRIAEHGGQCIMCGTMTRTCNGGVLHDDKGGGLVVCFAICLPCNFLPEADIAARARAVCDRLHAKGCN